MTVADPAVAAVTSPQATAALKHVVRKTTARTMEGLAKLAQQEIAGLMAGNTHWPDSASTVACARRFASMVGINTDHSVRPANQAAQTVDDHHRFCRSAQRPTRQPWIATATAARPLHVPVGDPAAPIRYHIGHPEPRFRLARAATSTWEQRA